MSAAYIVGAGDFAEGSFKPEKDDIIIAADAGLKHIIAHGYEADIAVGDFDSLGYVPDARRVVRLDSEKDDTDTQHAIDIAVSMGFRDIRLFGMLGGRIDHTIANIRMTAYIAQRGARGIIYGEDANITAVRNGTICFEKADKGMLSVFSVMREARGVTITGLKYPLCDAVLPQDVSLGVSNEFIGQEARISVSDGTLVIVYPREVSICL